VSKSSRFREAIHVHKLQRGVASVLSSVKQLHQPSSTSTTRLPSRSVITAAPCHTIRTYIPFGPNILDCVPRYIIMPSLRSLFDRYQASVTGRAFEIQSPEAAAELQTSHFSLGSSIQINNSKRTGLRWSVQDPIDCQNSKSGQSSAGSKFKIVGSTGKMTLPVPRHGQWTKWTVGEYVMKEQNGSCWEQELTPLPEGVAD
jgi:hypothetical protein